MSSATAEAGEKVPRIRAYRRLAGATIFAGRRVVRASDLYHSLISLGWLKFFGVLVLYYMAVNMAFGFGYWLAGASNFEGMGEHAGFRHFLDCFFFSVQTFATIGYGRIAPIGILADVLVTVEAMMGLLSISVATGLFYARFSRPTAKLTFSRGAVINTIDGVPSLLFRVANQRRNVIASAHIRATILITETTSEGETYRNLRDLELERSDTPIFALTWTIVHPITPDSPLHGKTREELAAAEAEILVTVEGVDDALAQPIHARHSYLPEEIAWDTRFVDILHRTPDGKMHINFEHFHSTEPVRRKS